MVSQRSFEAELLCRPDECPLPAKLHLHPETDMAEGAAPTVATGSLQLATAASPGGPILAQSVDPPPVAGTAVRRQIPEVGAGWFKPPRPDLCGGAPGNLRPYRDPSVSGDPRLSFGQSSASVHTASGSPRIRLSQRRCSPQTMTGSTPFILPQQVPISLLEFYLNELISLTRELPQAKHFLS